MDTMAFWLPLILLFLSALLGAVIKRRSCDHCSFDALYTRPKAVLRYALKDSS